MRHANILRVKNGSQFAVYLSLGVTSLIFNNKQEVRNLFLGRLTCEVAHNFLIAFNITRIGL